MRALILCSLLFAIACGDNKDQPARDDAGTGDGNGSGKLVGCLEQADVSPPPNGVLPCDLIPPGLELTP